MLQTFVNLCRKLSEYFHDLPDDVKGKMIFAGLGIIFIYFVWYYINKPLNRIMSLEDCGFIVHQDMTKKSTIRRSLNKIKFSKFPPVYPDGWFMLLESTDLKVSQVKHISALGIQFLGVCVFTHLTSGIEFAVFRAEDGVVHVLHAFCCHLGANLGIGGRVVQNNCLKCPFHGWTFEGPTGKCVEIPYATTSKIPTKAKLKRYHSCEINQHIYFWHHREDMPPSWQIPSLDEINNGKWKFAGRSVHYMNCHVEESSENGADMHHLSVVHKALATHGSDMSDIKDHHGEIGGHNWKVGWTCGDPHSDESHIGVMSVYHEIYLGRLTIPFTASNVEARQIGPGIVYLHFDSGSVFEGTILFHVTPVEPLQQKLSHQMWMRKHLPTVLGKLVLRTELAQIERDIMIWNNKAYPSTPLLIPDDSLMAKHRKWYSQFYKKEHEDTTPSPFLDDAGNLVETRPWLKADPHHLLANGQTELF